jgi:hypothetical protein
VLAQVQAVGQCLQAVEEEGDNICHVVEIFYPGVADNLYRVWPTTKAAKFFSCLEDLVRLKNSEFILTSID